MKLLLKTLLLFSLLVVPLLTQGQRSNKGEIQGKVLDSLSQSPVEFAIVTLFDTTNKTVNGAVCDEKGDFLIEGIPFGKYKLAVTFLGYKKVELTNLIVSSTRPTLRLDDISLGPIAQALQEVVIEGQKTLMEEKVDRTIYNAENDATNKGGDATDVLRKAPFVTVDMDGTVSLRGNSNLRILINNKPSTITASNLADALRQIPADQIKSVEVITSPSSKYDAEGAAGIINIVMKKNNLEGISLGIDASTGIRASSLGLNGSYRKNKSAFSLGGTGRAGYNTPGEFYNDQLTYSTSGDLSRNVQNATTRNNMLVGQYTAGWDYTINKNNSISTSLKYSLQNSYTYQDKLRTQTYQNDSLIGDNTKDIVVDNESYTIDASTQYTHTFETPQREFALLFMYSRNNRLYNYTSNLLQNPNESSIESRSRNENKSHNSEATVQVDYQTPTHKDHLLEFGAKNVLRKVSSMYQYLYSNGTASYLPAYNGNLDNTFNYNQNVSAAYLTYSLQFLKTWTLKAGARYEYTFIQADYQNHQSTKLDIPAYSILVPSITLAKKLANGNTIKASYNRRIQRPGLQALNPNMQSSNPLNVTQGNPYLHPEFGNNYELAYTANVQNNSFTVAYFMRMMTGDIQVIRDVIGKDTIRSIYQNLGLENNYGFNFLANISVSKKLMLNGGMDVFYRFIKNNDPNPLYTASNDGWSARYTLTASYLLPKDWGIQVFGTYRGKRIQLQGYQSGYYMYSMSMKKNLPHKKGSIGFGVENVFSPTIQIVTEVNSPTVQQYSTTVYHYLNFKINFTYVLGKTLKSDKSEKPEMHELGGQ